MIVVFPMLERKPVLLRPACFVIGIGGSWPSLRAGRSKRSGDLLRRMQSRNRQSRLQPTWPAFCLDAESRPWEKNAPSERCHQFPGQRETDPGCDQDGRHLEGPQGRDRSLIPGRQNAPTALPAPAQARTGQPDFSLYRCPRPPAKSTFPSADHPTSIRLPDTKPSRLGPGSDASDCPSNKSTAFASW